MKQFLFFSVFASFLMLVACAGGKDGESFQLGPGDGGTGIGGSTARFTIKGNYMYIVTDQKLKVMDITAPSEPKILENLSITTVAETVHIQGHYLFIGSQQAVLIYSIERGWDPRFITSFEHQTACDPVITNGDFAYVTIRDGQACRNTEVNELLVLDISDLSNPKQIEVISMIRPRGLGIYDGHLYVGEGPYGIKKFDISTPHKPQLDTFYTQIACNDLIGLPDKLLITANDGVSQYANESDSLFLLSKIE